MKRSADMSEQKWQDALAARKAVAEARMERRDASLSQIHGAARAWYGSADIDSCCLAENRLNRGEKPPKREDNTR